MNYRSVGVLLEEVAGFVNLQRRFESVEGWLHPLEGHFLHLLAAEGPGIGEIVEIGSYVGRSTSYLASGSKKSRRERVTAVDNFLGCPELKSDCESAQSKMLREHGSTFPVFQANLQRLGLADHVNAMVATSEDAARSWDKPIRLLFIDGEHSYEASRRDFELWSRFVVPGGVVCFHDIGIWPGVSRFYQELQNNSKDFMERFAVHTIRTMEKQ